MNRALQQRSPDRFRIDRGTTAVVPMIFACVSWFIAGYGIPQETDELVERVRGADLRGGREFVGLGNIEALSDQEYLRVELGRRLFFDPILSADGSRNCASCHRPEHAFSSPVPVAEGVHGRKGIRHPPVLINRRFGEAQFWDGRVASLEEQALEPIENENELASSVDEALQRLAGDPEYRSEFEKAFESGVTRENLAAALAAFERTLLSGDSPVDRFVAATHGSALTQSQRQGLWIYESKGGCWKCHSGSNYSDERFHNTGVSWHTPPRDTGLAAVTGETADTGKFKTPTLRDVALSAPYMHDGSLATLRDVIDFYDRGGNSNPWLDPELKPLQLTEQEKLDLEEFLKAMTGRHAWD